MKPIEGKILVEVEYDQKKNVSIGGGTLLLAKEFSENRRESQPVVCRVVDGNNKIKDGTYLLVHHNRFSENSPHHLGGNQYSLPYNESIFAKLDEEGNAHSLCDNIIVNQVFDNNSELIPGHLKKPHKTKYNVIGNGYGFKKGQTVFAYPFSNYEIVYIFKGVEHRVIKLKKSDIVGKLL